MVFLSVCLFVLRLYFSEATLGEYPYNNGFLKLKLQERLSMSKYVEIGYPIYEGMPVYPGLPEVKLEPRERLDKGDA